MRCGTKYQHNVNFLCAYLNSIFLLPVGQHSALTKDPGLVVVNTKPPISYSALQKTHIWLQYPQSSPCLTMTLWDDSTFFSCWRSRFGCCTYKAAHILLMTLARTFVFQSLAYVIDKKISTSSILFIVRISCFKIYDWIKIQCMCTSYSLFIRLDTYHLTPFFSK